MTKPTGYLNGKIEDLEKRVAELESLHGLGNDQKPLSIDLLLTYLKLHSIFDSNYELKVEVTSCGWTYLSWYLDEHRILKVSAETYDAAIKEMYRKTVKRMFAPPGRG